VLGPELSTIELSGFEPASFDSAISDSSSSVLSNSPSTGSSEGFIGRANFAFAETARSGDDSDKDDSDKDGAKNDPGCGFNFGRGVVVSISSMAECISVVRAGAESVALETAAGTTAGTKLRAGSAKLVSCDETPPAAAACARSSVMPAPGVTKLGITALCASALAGCGGTLSFV
jgi:hypothetical protein